MSQGISQQEQGADILDVNVGLPEIDEVKIIQQATEQLQGSTLLPLQIDSTDPAAVEAAVRRYAGKPIINSVNGKQQIMDEIFPLVATTAPTLSALRSTKAASPIPPRPALPSPSASWPRLPATASARTVSSSTAWS